MSLKQYWLSLGNSQYNVLSTLYSNKKRQFGALKYWNKCEKHSPVLQKNFLCCKHSCFTCMQIPQNANKHKILVNCFPVILKTTFTYILLNWERYLNYSINVRNYCNPCRSVCVLAECSEEQCCSHDSWKSEIKSLIWDHDRDQTI